MGTSNKGSTAFQDDVSPRFSDQRDDRVLARRVEPVPAEAVVVELGDESGGPGGIVVGKRAMLEERAALRDGGEGGADATRSDDESSHGAWLYTEHLVRRIAHGGARLPSISPIGGRT